MNAFKISEMEKVLLSSKRLSLLYCKNNTLGVDYSNQINLPSSLDSLLQ